MDPRLVMWKSAVLELVCVMTEVFAPLEVAKTGPPSEMVLVCWGYVEVEYFHSESVVSLVVMVKFVSAVEICFCAKSGQYN